MSRECGEGAPGGRACRGGGLNLDILKDVQKAYEERLNAVERYGGPRKLQMQVDVMKSWVDDLAGQNSLLVRAVEELETEATAKLLQERANHSEDKKGKQCKELKNITDFSRACSKRDAEVSAGICCSDLVEHGGGEAPFSAALLDEAGQCREKIAKLETKLKSAEQNVCALRKVNVALSEELHALRRVCAALDEQCRASTLRAQFKDEIIYEMRRQLKQAKAKLRDLEAMCKAQGDFELKATNLSLSRCSRAVCVRQQPRRRVGALTAPPAGARAAGDPPGGPLAPRADSNEGRTPRLDGSGDDVFSIRSS